MNIMDPLIAFPAGAGDRDTIAEKGSVAFYQSECGMIDTARNPLTASLLQVSSP